MKKILSMLLVVVMLATCIMALSACAPKPALKDLEEVAETLEDADYYASYSDDEDYLGIGMVERLYAYDKDDDSDNTLVIIVYESAKLAKIAYKEAKLNLEMEEKELKLEIKKIETILKEYSGELKSAEIDAYEDELKDLEEELELYKEYVVGISGKTVWYGTKEAIKDSKG